MQCPQCQYANRAGRRFCAECGVPLLLACPACGFTNEPGEKFCGGCGTLLSDPAAQPMQLAQYPVPSAVQRHQEAPPPVARVTPEAERRSKSWRHNAVGTTPCCYTQYGPRHGGCVR
jgi:hypothetical protein